jgi:predicted CoA-binding protein
MNHREDYQAEYLASILSEAKTIAMVGASSDPTKFSYGVYGYCMNRAIT